MICRISALAALLFVGGTVAAHADSIVAYDFTNDTGQLSGSVEIQNGVVIEGDFTFTDNKGTFTFVGAPTDSATGPQGLILTTHFTDSNGDIFRLSLETTPIAPGELAVCSATVTCALDPSVFNPINGVNVYPEQADLVAVAPEPSSFVLLGTGALGLAGAVRRRFLNA